MTRILSFIKSALVVASIGTAFIAEATGPYYMGVLVQGEAFSLSADTGLYTDKSDGEESIVIDGPFLKNAPEALADDEVAYDYVPASIIPGEGAEMEVLETVSVTYGSADIFAVIEGFDAALYTESFNLDTFMVERQKVATARVVANEDLTGCLYTFSPAITTPGTYILVIPEGAFGDEAYCGSVENENKKGMASKIIELHYYVTGSSNPLTPAEFTVTAESITPENNATVEEISTVTVKLSESLYPYMPIDEFNPIDVGVGTIYSLDGDNVETLESVVPMDNDPNFMSPTIYDFKFNPVTEVGQYKVVIPRGTFGDDTFIQTFKESGVSNEEIVLYYAIGQTVGVESIVGDTDVINVYDVDGLPVLKDAPVDAAKELKSGLYIINGKKVAIRR